MPKEDKGKVKLTVIQFETESDNETLQENIKSITQTLMKALAPPPRIVQAPSQLANGNNNNDRVTEVVAEVYEEDDAIEAEVVNKKPKAKTVVKFSPPKALDLDLISGDMPLKKFLDEKNPGKSQIRRYLAIAYWFKHYRDTPEITKDHAYTCFRFIGWSDVPKDVGSPFRQMKKTQYGYMNAGSAEGLYAINHIGENVVVQMGSSV